MVVTRINQNENKQKRASYLKSIAIGGTAGYILKHTLPLTKQEKEVNFSLYTAELKKQVNEIKRQEIETISNSQNKTLAEDCFVKMVKNNELKFSKIKELKEPLLSDVKRLITRVNDKGRIAKKDANEVFTILTKHIRPTKTFVGLGAGAAVAIAFVSNTLGKFSNKQVLDI